MKRIYALELLSALCVIVTVVFVPLKDELLGWTLLGLGTVSVAAAIYLLFRGEEEG